MEITLVLARFNKWVSERFEIKRGGNIIDKQRFYTYIYMTMGLIVGISVNLSGITGPQETFFKYANSIHLVSTISLLLLVVCHRLTINKALIILILITQLEVTAEMLFSAFTNGTYHLALIIGNTVLLSILLMLSIIAYVRYIPIVICTISIVTYGTCILITKNETILNFFIVFVLAYLVMTMMSHRFIKQFNKLEGENTDLRRQHNEMRDLFDMTEVQMQAYLSLAQEKGKSKAEVEHLMEQMGGRIRKNIRYNIHLLIEQERVDYENMEQVFPQLTITEREICRLVLEGKKLSEVSRILDKSETTISCHRSNIRAKLDLKQGDNLRKKLLEIAQK